VGRAGGGGGGGGAGEEYVNKTKVRRKKRFPVRHGGKKGKFGAGGDAKRGGNPHLGASRVMPVCSSITIGGKGKDHGRKGC